jgi:hypothetical protein
MAIKAPREPTRRVTTITAIVISSFRCFDISDH